MNPYRPHVSSYKPPISLDYPFELNLPFSPDNDIFDDNQFSLHSDPVFEEGSQLTFIVIYRAMENTRK